MSQFEDVLEQCLDQLAQDASTVEECLARHPEHAAQLEPILSTASRIHNGIRQINPSAVFKARARAKLTLHMQANPRRKSFFDFNIRRFATGFVVLLLTFLVTGTVYAQGALPGDTLYGWKLASEGAWRLVSPNSVDTDFAIANRRIDEINATVNDPNRRAQAVEGYRTVKNRLESELGDDKVEHILPPVDMIDDFDSLSHSSTPIPTITPPWAENGNGNGNGNNGNGNGNGNGHGNGNNGNGNIKEPKPTKQPKIIPTIEVPPPIK